MKDFIRDGGKVRECVSNIAKMNILEYMWYRRRVIARTLRDSLGQFYEGSTLLIAGIINLLMVILLPITYPIVAYLNIRNARKEMKLQQGD